MELFPKHLDLQTQWESEIIDLQKRIDRAFLLRPTKDYDPDKKTLVDDLASAHQLSEKRKKGTSAFFTIKDETALHEVIVENSHMYPALLRMAFSKLIPSVGMSIEKRERLIMKDLEHEYAHTIPALGQEGVTVVYGVSFYRIRNIRTGERGDSFNPFIKPIGKVPVVIYDQMVLAPKKLSGKDKEAGRRRHQDKSNS
jgi:hypothetical protein